MSWTITPRFTQWTPADISTALWLDAADASTVTESGGAVSQWNDKSGNSRHAAQATAASRPTVLTASQNGRNVLSFDGSNDFLLTTAASYSAVEYYLVGLFAGSSTQNRLYYAARTSPNANKGAASDITCGLGYGFDTPGTGGSLKWTNVGANATAAQVNGSDVSSLASYNNYEIGISPASGWFIANQTISASASGSKQFCIGADIFDTVGNRHIQASMAEFIIISSSLNTLDRQKLQGYLAHKWGLTSNLPANHPYKVNPPAP
jgi:hypothetical protein